MWQWWDEYFARNARCTVTTDLLCDIPTHKTTSAPEQPFFSLHTLAPPSGRNVNYDQKQLTGKNFLSCSFCLCRFHKYLSYGFPIINFCNPGVHYETPCIQWCNSLPCCIYVNQCQGFTILMQLYLYMFMFEYACDMAFIVLEVAVTANTCSEVKCVF